MKEGGRETGREGDKEGGMEGEYIAAAVWKPHSDSVVQQRFSIPKLCSRKPENLQ